MLFLRLQNSANILFKIILGVYFFIDIQAAPEGFKKDKVDDQCQQNNRDELLLYSDISLFKHQNIDLALQNPDTLALNFDNVLQESFITHYMYEGKLVGHVLNEHNKVHFTAAFAQPYNFVVKGPIKTGLFLAQTQSKFTFQNKIEAQIAAIACNSVVFDNVFNSNKALEVQADSCHNHGHLNCLNFTFNGNYFHVTPQAILDVQGGAHFLGLKSFVNDGQLSLGKDARIITDLLENHGDIDVDNFYVESQSIKNLGMIDALYFNMKARDFIVQDGKINVDYLSMRANYIYNSGNLITHNGDINVNRLLCNSGNIVVDNNLNLNAFVSVNVCSVERFRNFIKKPFDWQHAQKFLYNPFLLFNAENLSSFCGVIRAKNLVDNTGLNFNIGGIYQTQNGTINSLIDINAGLYTPQLYLWNDFFSQNNLYQIGKPFCMMCLPAPVRLTYQLAMASYLLPSIYKKACNNYRQIQALLDQENFAVCDLIPLACAMKDSVVSAVQLRATTQTACDSLHAYNKVQEYTHILSDQIKQDSDQVKDSILVDLAKVVAGSGGHLASSSLLNINTGAIFGVNGSSSSLFNMHTGISAFLNNNTVDTCYGLNSGVYAARNLTVHATNDYLSKGSYYGFSGSMTANNLDISEGDIRISHRLELQSNKKTIISALIDCADIDIKAHDCSLQAASKIYGENVSLHAENAINQLGQVDTKDFNTTAKFIGLSGTINAQNGDVKTGAFVADSQSVMNIKNCTMNIDSSLEQSGQIDGENINIQAQSIKNSGVINAQVGDIRADDIVADTNSVMNIQYCNMQAKNFIEQYGKINSDLLFFRTKFFNNEGVINSVNASMNADRLFYNSGNILVQNNLNLIALAAIHTCHLERVSKLAANPIDLQHTQNLLSNPVDLLKAENWNSSVSVMRAKNLNIHSMLHVNLGGVYQSQNGRINSYLNYNAGLYVPQLDSFYDLCTYNNAYQTSISLCMLYAPDWTRLTYQIGATLYSLPSLCKNACQNYNDAKALFDRDDLEACDIIPLACGIKDTAVSMIHSYDTVKKAGINAFEILSDEDKRNEMMSMPSCESMQKAAKTYIDETSQKVKLYDVAKVVGECGPHLKTSSLLDVNAGALVGCNAHSTSLWSYNYGISAFANNNTVDTCYGSNYGIYAGGQLNIHATGNYSSSGACYGVSGTMAADNLDISGGKINMLDHLSLYGKDFVKGDCKSLISASAGTYINAKKLNFQGSIHGGLSLNVGEQPKNIGNVDCQGKDFVYQGPVQNGFADELASGKGDRIQVCNQGKTFVLAGNQDIHLEQEHDLAYDFIVQTAGSIDANKKIAAKGSILFDVGQNVHHASLTASKSIGIVAGNNIDAQSTKQCVGDDKNYSDVIDQVTLDVGDGIYVDAGEDINYSSVDTTSGNEGTTLFAGGNIIDDALILESSTENHKTEHKRNITTQDIFTDTAVSHHTSKGAYTVQAQGTYNGVAPHIQAKTAFIQGVKGTTLHDAHSTHKHTLQSVKNGGRFGHSENKEESSYSSISHGAHFDTESKPLISAPQGDISITNISGQAPILEVGAGHKAEIVLGKNSHENQSLKACSNLLYRSKSKKSHKDTKSIPLSVQGQMESNAQLTMLEIGKGQKLNIAEMMKVHGDGVIDIKFVENIHFEFSRLQIQLTDEAKIVLALAISTATAGVACSAGAGVVAALNINSVIAAKMVANMTATAIVSLANQSAIALIEANGNPVQAGKILASTDIVKQLAISVVTAGLSGAAQQALTELGLPVINEGKNVAESCLYAAPRELVGAAIATGAQMVQGQDALIAIKNSVARIAAGTVGNACASHIGTLYGQDKIDPVTHKLLHAANGAVQGGIVGGWNGVIAGGSGALIAETVADVFAPKAPALASVYELESQIGRALTQEEFYHYWNEQTEGYIRSIGHVEHAAKITATLAAVAARHDVSTADLAAHAAIDNNFLILAGYGITTACAAYSAKNVYDAYQDHGIEGVLHQLGIEVVTYAAGYAAGKVVFKIGSAVYPTAQVAMNVALDATPGLKHALGSVADTLIVAGERFGQTKLGQAITSVEVALTHAEQQAYRKAVAAKDAILKQIVGKAETVVENALPASSRMSKLRLRNQLIAEEISNGHAFDKHIIAQSEFPGLIQTKAQFKQHIENILNDQPVKLYQQTSMNEILNINPVTGKTTKEIKSITYYVDDIAKPTIWFKTSGEKKFIYKESSQTLVIYNPNACDGGTAYQPRTGIQEFFKQN